MKNIFIQKWMAGVVLSLLLLAGCAHASNSKACLRVAQNSSSGVCKHCNCLMPAGAAGKAPCPVCNCGYRSEHCYRGQ